MLRVLKKHETCFVKVDSKGLLSYGSEIEEKTPTKASVLAPRGRDFGVCYD